MAVADLPTSSTPGPTPPSRAEIKRRLAAVDSQLGPLAEVDVDEFMTALWTSSPSRDGAASNPLLLFPQNRFLDVLEGMAVKRHYEQRLR